MLDTSEVQIFTQIQKHTPNPNQKLKINMLQYNFISYCVTSVSFLYAEQVYLMRLTQNINTYKVTHHEIFVIELPVTTQGSNCSTSHRNTLHVAFKRLCID